MDLKAILSHRTHCLICGTQLECYALDYPKLTFFINENGMKVSSGHTPRGIRMFFGFDGKYTRTKQNYKVYREPISVVKRCRNCWKSDDMSLEFNSVPRPAIQLKGRSVGMTAVTHTTINNMKNLECAYRFQIMGDSLGNYDGCMNYEIVRYCNDEAFWHVDTSFVTGSSILSHGKFDKKIEDILSIKVAAPVNLSSVENTDQFLSKFKMYTLMS